MKTSRTDTSEVKFYGSKKTSTVAVSLYEKDAQLLNWLTEYLGCSKSEAVRSAVRHMASHVGYLEGHGKK